MPDDVHELQGVMHMNWDQIEGRWTEMKGKARASWGELTDDELTQIGGKKDQLVGKLQQKYGLEREEAERRADDWANGL
tara:strand:+ start:44 stop:280 length:237 start_codon:yes stop_codon:yes gene_type:complete